MRKRGLKVALREMDDKLADEPELKQLMDAMQTSGLALEQEAVWLKQTLGN